jgi:hypothetical protein
VKLGNGTGGGDGRCSGCGWRMGGGDGCVFWVVKWWLGALGMREERRGWERGLHGVRGNEVEKEEGDLKRSRGGSESSALDRTKVRSIALEQNHAVRGRSALWACFVALCARAYMNAIPRMRSSLQIYARSQVAENQNKKIQNKQ